MNNDLSKKYQKKSDKQHVLDNPDTYIGSVEYIEQKNYICNDTPDNESDKEIIEKNIKYVPGLYKLFDEAIVNCRDHYVRMLDNQDKNNHQVSEISVEIDEENGIITLLACTSCHSILFAKVSPPPPSPSLALFFCL